MQLFGAQRFTGFISSSNYESKQI